MFKILTYSIFMLFSSILWLLSFIIATTGLAIGIVSGSRVNWIGILFSIALFVIAFCCQWLAKFLDPSFIYYGDD